MFLVDFPFQLSSVWFLNFQILSCPVRSSLLPVFTSSTSCFSWNVVFLLVSSWDLCFLPRITFTCPACVPLSAPPWCRSTLLLYLSPCAPFVSQIVAWPFLVFLILICSLVSDLRTLLDSACPRWICLLIRLIPWFWSLFACHIKILNYTPLYLCGRHSGTKTLQCSVNVSTTQLYRACLFNCTTNNNIGKKNKPKTPVLFEYPKISWCYSSPLPWLLSIFW